MSAMTEKMKALMSDEKMINKLLSINDPEEARKFFAENGMEFTIEEIHMLAGCLNRMAENNGELSDASLNDVSGGSSASMIPIASLLAPLAAEGRRREPQGW